MKKILSLVVLLFAATIGFVNAQTSAGNMMLGGGISFSTTSYEASSDVEDSYISFSPSFGYFVADNFVVGAGLSILNSVEDNGFNRTEWSSFGFGPFVRYYKFTSNDKFAFYGQASLLFESGKQDATPGGEVKTGATTFAVSPGFAYFFNEHWAVELQLAGFIVNSSDPNKDTDNNRSTDVIFSIESFNPTLGLRFHF